MAKNVTIKKYEELTFTDDFMFGKVMYHNLDLCKEVLEMILGRKIRRIESPETQKTVTITGDAKGVRFDVYTEDDDEMVYDVEMQTAYDTCLPKRSRYYHGMLDLNLIERGAKYDDLKECYVIFICKEAPGGKPVYSYQMRDDASPHSLLNDGNHTVFVNASGSLDGVTPQIREFLEYVRYGKVPENGDSLARRLEDAVERARLHEEWRIEYMTLLMRDQKMREEGRAEGLEEGRAEGLEKGREEGREEERRNIVLNFYVNGASIQMIAAGTQLSEPEVEEIIRSSKQPV